MYLFVIILELEIIKVFIHKVIVTGFVKMLDWILSSNISTLQGFNSTCSATFIVQLFDWKILMDALHQEIGKETIDEQHLRPATCVALLLEIIEREIFDA